MNTIQAGETAFPNHPKMPIGAPGEGMTLRDYFAAKAMQGLCAHPESPDWDESDIAKSAYDQADAMLKARGQ